MHNSGTLLFLSFIFSRTIAQFRDTRFSLSFSLDQKFTWRCVLHRFRPNLSSLDFAFLFWFRIFSSHGYTRSDAFSLTVPKHRLWSFAYWLWLFLNLKDSHPPANLILSVSVIIIVLYDILLIDIGKYMVVLHISTLILPKPLWFSGYSRRFSTVGRVLSASPYLLFWLYKLVIHLPAYLSQLPVTHGFSILVWVNT